MIDLQLPAGPLAPGDARHALDKLVGVLDSDRLDELRLLVSELVTNSVRHAGLGTEDRVGLRVRVSGGAVRVEVADRGPGFDAGPPLPSMYQDSGWGLYLVEQIADRWGVSQKDETCVWFELDR